MNTRTDKILGASLTLAAFSFITATQVAAQTCVTPPTCESLGYNKTTADCEGKTILKCPFDTSQVYCPGNNEESTITSYKVGDDYFVDGYSIGRVIEINDNNITVASPLKVNSLEITDYCDSLSPETWIAPDKSSGQKIFRVYSGSYSQTWSYLKLNGNAESLYYCLSPSGTTWPKSSCSSPSFTLYSSCITSVQAN